MSYHRTPLLDLIDAYAEFVGYHVSNTVSHIVTEDYNLTDDNLGFQFKWIEEHRAEWLIEPEGVTEQDIAYGIAFLTFLKSIPEDVRCSHDDGWDEDFREETPNEPLLSENPKSQKWLDRHGG